MKIKKRKLINLLKETLSSNEIIPISKKEDIVERIIQKLLISGIVGSDNKKGLIDYVDNYDEFEDLIRYIVDATGLPNNHNQIYFILKSIADDFRVSPEDAATMSKFNISTGTAK